jgi:hypothetical protein
VDNGIIILGALMDDPSPGRNLPAVIENKIGDDGREKVTEADDDLATVLRDVRGQRINSWRLWLVIVALVVVGGITYRAFFLTDVTQHGERTPLAAGWMELGSCTFTRSFDGRRQMALNEDQTAEVREPSQPVQQSKEGDEHASKGRWSYDEDVEAIRRHSERWNDELLASVARWH